MDGTEKKCVNWFMRKSGKLWIYGCSIIVCGLVLGGSTVAVYADDTSNVTIPSNSVVQPDTTLADSGETGSLETSAPASEQVSKEPAADISIDKNKETIDNQNQGKPVATVGENSVSNQIHISSSNIETVPQETEVSYSDIVEPTTSNVINKKVDKLSNAVTRTDSRDLTQANFKTNLEDVSYDKTVWDYRDKGLYSNAVGKGDKFFLSNSQGKNFIFQTNVTFLQNTGAASLVFRANNDVNHLKGYVVNLDGGSHKAKLWRWAEANLIDEKDVTPSANNTYTLKVIAANGWLTYYVNGELVANLSDYTLQRSDLGQTTYIPEGYFGLLNWNGEMIFQNTFYKNLTDSELPFIEDVTVTSDKGIVEKKGQFFSSGATYIQYVSNEADTVNLSFVGHNPKVKISVKDSNGHLYPDYSNIPLNVGANYLTVISDYTTEDGYTATLTYRINIHRRQPKEVYYNENYRDQYHYSVKDGWANDPNGLVYYKGVYHMFYQFYDDTQWGPMHWAHATSKDLIHWNEEPIAFYPDYNGAMFSGSIVVDDKNTSGLFDSPDGGLVALITADGEGQRIKLAYSKDEGKTWTKVDKIVADWSNDPLQSRDFRDPKVFHWNNKWFMVLAGGPLRIYSSDNLLDWTVESTYPDLHTECPDLYPIQTEDNTIKWVLSRGGRYYKIGDFKQVNGKWQFVADEDYESKDGIMNFGKDSYAAMTYYVQDFGTSDNPTIPKIVELNWMNTWEDYCNQVAQKVGQKFNGTFNLNLALGLKKEGNKYLLTQSPIEAYSTLRDTDKSIHYQNISVSENNNLFKDFSGDTYEIVAHFTPNKGTKKVGFNLRVGNDEVTKVIYDLKTETLSLDRSQSGVIISNKFAEVNSQQVKCNPDGSIDLHLFVDRASVEVFAQGDTVAGANQIFPAPTSLGLGVLVDGESTQADIALYPLKTIWDKVTVTEPLEVVPISKQETRMNVGETTVIKAYVMPANASQDIIWTVNDPSAVLTQPKGNQLTVKALKKGTITVRASSKVNPSLYKDFSLNILDNNFKTNMKNMKAVAGDWYIDGDSLRVSNQSSNDAYMSSTSLDYDTYQMDVDIKYEKGVVNIFFASASSNPANAYAIQFGDSDSVRLYRFYGDTIKESSLPSKLNDNKLHHVRVIKTSNAVQVLVDDQEVLTHTFASLDDYFNKPYVGLGLWDGSLEVQNFFINDLNAPVVPEHSNDEANMNGSDSSQAKVDISSDSKGMDSEDKSAKATIFTQQENPSTSKEQAKPSKQSLPTTGDSEDDASTLGFISLLLGLGLFLTKFLGRRRNEE